MAGFTNLEVEKVMQSGMEPLNHTPPPSPPSKSLGAGIIVVMKTTCILHLTCQHIHRPICKGSDRINGHITSDNPS